MPTDTQTPARRPRAGTDAVLLAAVDEARAAAVETAGDDTVGAHLGSEADGDRTLTHFFATTSPGYRGWHWAVTLARVPRSRTATVSEVHLLPGADSIVSPAWLPWAERVAPGDVAPGAVLPRRLDDPRLEEGFEATGDEDVDQVAFWELGLGRTRVLSREGREDAAQRWYEGSHGPRDPHAEQAPAHCTSCGWFVPMAGALRRVFGVCAGEWSPFDGQVVSLDHGCGAHSEAEVEAEPEHADPVLDEVGDVEFEVTVPADAAPPVAAEPVVVVSADETGPTDAPDGSDGSDGSDEADEIEPIDLVEPTDAEPGLGADPVATTDADDADDPDDPGGKDEAVEPDEPIGLEEPADADASAAGPAGATSGEPPVG